MDFVEIVIDGPTDVDRDDVEDTLSAALGPYGDVTGAGTGIDGANLDLDVDPDVGRVEVLGRIFAALNRLQLGDSVRVRPGDGQVWIRPSEWRG
jgi:hypothetical protein